MKGLRPTEGLICRRSKLSMKMATSNFCLELSNLFHKRMVPILRRGSFALNFKEISIVSAKNLDFKVFRKT